MHHGQISFILEDIRLRKALLIRKFGSPKRKKETIVRLNSERRGILLHEMWRRSSAKTVSMIVFFEVFRREKCFMTIQSFLPPTLLNHGSMVERGSLWLVGGLVSFNRNGPPIEASLIHSRRTWLKYFATSGWQKTMWLWVKYNKRPIRNLELRLRIWPWWDYIYILPVGDWWSINSPDS